MLFFINQRWYPRAMLMAELEEISLEKPTIAIYAEKMIKLFKTLVTRYYNKNRKSITFKARDQVWLYTTNIQIQ